MKILSRCGALLAMLLVSSFGAVSLAQRTGAGSQSGSPRAPAPVGWVFTDANGSMGVAYNDGQWFDAWGAVPLTEVNGSGHLTYINPNATTGASGNSTDGATFSENLPQAADWSINLSSNMYVMSQGYGAWSGQPPGPRGYIYAEALGVLALWGSFKASKGASRVTDDAGFVLYPPAGCVDMGWVLPNGEFVTFKGDANSGFRFMSPEYILKNPQTYNPNIAHVSLAAVQSIANVQNCTFCYQSTGHTTVNNTRDGAYMESTYRHEPNSYGTTNWYGNVTGTYTDSGGRIRTYAFELR